MATKPRKSRQTPRRNDPTMPMGPNGNELVESLDDFVRDMHGTTPTGEAGGLPSLLALKEKFKTKSAAIRHLHIDHNASVKDIAKHLGLRYQHVRNVLKTELKRGPNEDFHLGEGQSASVIKTEDDPTEIPS